MRIIPIGRTTAGKYRSKVAKLGECYGAAHFILTVRGCAALAAAGTTPGSGTTTWGIASPAASLVKQLSPVRCQLSPVVGWILPCEIARGCSLRPVRAAAVFAPSPPHPRPLSQPWRWRVGLLGGLGEGSVSMAIGGMTANGRMTRIDHSWVTILLLAQKPFRHYPVNYSRNPLIRCQSLPSPPAPLPAVALAGGGCWVGWERGVC